MERRVYSERFKRQVVEEVDAGKWSSPTEAAEAYGIPYVGSITRWRHRINNTKPQTVYVMDADEQNEVKRLRQRIRDLEAALAHTQVEAVIDKAYLQVACEEFGITDIEAFKKNADSKRLQ